VNSKNYEAPQYSIFSNLLLPSVPLNKYTTSQNACNAIFYPNSIILRSYHASFLYNDLLRLSSGGQSPACHSECPGSIPGHTM